MENVKYLTVLLRYEGDPPPVPELDDMLLGGEVTAVVKYDAIHVANTAVNALDEIVNTGERQVAVEAVDEIILLTSS